MPSMASKRSEDLSRAASMAMREAKRLMLWLRWARVVTPLIGLVLVVTIWGLRLRVDGTGVSWLLALCCVILVGVIWLVVHAVIHLLDRAGSAESG